MATRRKKPTMISLFAGGGGLHLGLVRAGFEPVFATDIEGSAAATFAENWPKTRFHHGDVRHLTPADVAALTEGRKVDLVVGGPPCQGFSTLGDQIQGDPRNGLFEAFARVISWVEPRCFLMENTSYLRSQYAGRYEQEIARSFERLGYSVDLQTLNAADYGTPQVRKRVFFVGTRLAAPFRWPPPSHGPRSRSGRPYATVGEAIMDLVRKKDGAVSNHAALNHGDVVVARYRLIPEGGRLPPPQELPPEIRRRNFGNTYKRLHRKRPSLTLVPGNNAFPVHPTRHRSLTPREAARLQGFPDAYVFAGSRAEQCRLVGNAVPVQLAEALGRALKRHIAAGERQAAHVDARVRQLEHPPVPTPLARGQGSRLTAASFFTGAGGLLLGFARGGFEILGSVDRKSVVARNLRPNFPHVPHLHRDINEVTSRELFAAFGGRAPDVVFGGSPCQGFSIFGRRRFVNTRSHDPAKDERNELTLRYVELALQLEPKVILLENVKGLLSTRRGKSTYIEDVTNALERAGYQVDCRVVNCAEYGVPQLRERLLLVASAREVEFDWPRPKFFADPKSWQRGYVTVGDVISDLADPATHNATFSHVPMAHKELVVERYKLIPEGGRLPEADLPARLRKGYRSENVRNYSHVYRRLARDKPATTMVPGHNAFPVHPTLPRTLTVREAARIQTFPDWFRFVGTRQQQCMLVGNAVPPVLAEVFAQAVVKAIHGNAKQPGYKADVYELKAGGA